MNRVGEGGRASLLDRLIAKGDVATGGLPMSPMLLAAPIPFVVPPLVTIVGERWFAGLALLISLLPLLWLGLWLARAMHGRLNPYASPRWLHAVRGVIGDETMTDLLIELDRQHAREPGHVITRREVADAVAVRRWRARDAKKRGRGVRLGGPVA